MTKAMDGIRRLPAVGLLAERQMGGFLALSALVGVAVGLGAAALILLIDRLESVFEAFAIDQGHGFIFLTVPAGFFLAWLLARRLAPEVSGDGVPEAKAALEVHGGRMRGRTIPLKILATSVTIGAGGSAGREGPIVQIGAAIGSVLSKWFRLGEDQVRSLVAAGAGAAIGASFNAPIAGMLFALEVILSSFAVRHMSAIVIASITAAVTTRSIVGQELAIQAEFYRLNDPRELLLYAALALVVVAVGLLFLRLLDSLEGFARAHDRRLWVLRPIGAGILVAALVYFEPLLFGTGQDTTNRLLLGERVSAITGVESQVWWAFLLLGVGKAVATSLTISSGASGGAFMPSLFMGAAVGTGFARLVAPLWEITPGLVPGAFAVVGMAAMFAVVGRAPLTAILIVFEVTGARDYQLILPLMLTATLATFLADRIHPDSVYTMALRHRGIRLRRAGEVDLLDTVEVGRVMHRRPPTCSPDEPVTEVEARLHQLRSHGMPVVEGERLVGIVTMSDIGRADTSRATPVGEVMTTRPVTVAPSTPVSTALERMAVLGVGRLPVVAEDDPHRLVGLFRREEAVRAYHEALGTSTEVELHRDRLSQRTDPGAHYYEFRVPPGSIADDKMIREVTWPEGSTLVSVRRGREVIVPRGDTVLHPGDQLTAFGTAASREQMIERLNAGADEPTAEILIEELQPPDSEEEAAS